MSKIDNRVVQMQFNNGQFENGINTSIKSLDALKKGLDLGGSVRGLAELDRAGRSFSLSGIADAVDQVSSKFTAMGAAWFTVIQNITNSALQAGKNIISALTIDPIKTGFEEYETKMNAIQTILTNTKSKGTTLDDVNETLNELNEYSDKTIYNFAQMAKNIGTFTAAGNGLKESATAIKGIANLAAGSGSSSEQASVAMYQLSQALATGTVRLLDWNSVVNAGMGGELFQKALEKTATELGNGRNMAVSFRDSLQDGWLTTEVLMKTLANFAEDKSLVEAATQVKTFTQLFSTMKESVQSGWAQSWENIIGNKEQAAAFFTEINNGFSNIIGGATEARNKMLSFWDANGGRQAMIDSIFNTFRGIMSILKPIGEAFRDIFPATTGQRLVEISKAIRNLTTSFKMGDETAKNLKDTFRGLFAVLDIGRMAFVAIVNGIFSIVKAIFPATGNLLSLTGGVGNFITAIRDAIKSSDAFGVVIENIGKVLKPVAETIVMFTSLIAGAFKAARSPDMSGVDDFAKEMEDKFEPLIRLGEGIKAFFAFFYNLADVIGNIFKGLGESILNSLNNLDFKSVFDIINGGLFAAILFGIKRFTDSLGMITKIFDGVRGCLEAYQNQLKAGILIKIAIAIGILAASLLVISSIDSVKLTVALAAMSAMLVQLFVAMSVFSGIAGIKGIFAMTSLVAGMIGLSIAVLLFASAVKKLASVDIGGLLKGLVGVGLLMTQLVLFMKVADFGKVGVIKSVGILILAMALNVLASAVRKLSNISLGDLIKGLAGLAVMLKTISVFINASADFKRVLTTAAGLTVLGIAINILAVALGKMGSMSWQEMIRGLLTLGGALAIVNIALALLPKNIFIQSIALIDVAGAMMILAKALKAMADMSWQEIARSLTAMTVSLGVIIAAFVLLKKTGSMADSTAFLVLAFSITVLAGALKTIGSMSLAQIGGALLGLAGSFVVIGTAATLLTPVIPAILALSVAIALLGVGIVAIGGGILALSTGIAALAVAGTAGTVALVALVTALIGLIPNAARILAEGVIAFAKVLGEGATVIAAAVKSIILAMIDLFVTLAPALTDAFLRLITSMLDSALKYLPHFIDVGAKLVIAFLKGVSENIGEVVSTAVDVVVGFIEGIASKIGDIIQAGYDLMVSFINGLATAIDKNTEVVLDSIRNLMFTIVKVAVRVLTNSVKDFVKIGGQIVSGLLKGIKDKIASVVEGVTNLALSAIKAAKVALDTNSPSVKFKEIGENIGAGLALGIDKSSPKAEASSAKMSKKAVKAAEKAAADTAKAAEKAAKDAFDASVSWIDDRKYYNEMSLYQELDAWERVQSRYLAGTEERKKADREVYRVKQEIAKADKDFSQQIIDVAREAKDKKIQYEQEYYDKTKQINDKLESDIQSLNDKYKSALESRTKALYDAYGLFDKIEPSDPVSGTDLIKNLQDQVNEFDNWTNSMSELSGKGIDSALMDELEQMGPRSLAQIQALNALSQPELDEYVFLWQQKSSQAKSVAIKELEGLRIETRNQIRDLNIQAEIDLEEQRVIFEEKTKQLAEETAATIEGLKNDWLKKIGELRTKGEKDFRTFADNIVTIMGTPDWEGVGGDIVDGMTSGVRGQASQLADAAVDAALDALQAARDALGIASPSKKFAELGKYSIIGFVEGLKNFGGLAVSSASNVGSSAISAFKRVISDISDAVDGNLDMAPVIRPVLDLTDVKAGGLLINDLFAQSQGINVSDVRKRLPTFSKAGAQDEINDVKAPGETKISFTQHNYSPKALSRLEIYRQTRNQISLLKGVVSNA